jgi:hypothetical protein
MKAEGQEGARAEHAEMGKTYPPATKCAHDLAIGAGFDAIAFVIRVYAAVSLSSRGSESCISIGCERVSGCGAAPGVWEVIEVMMADEEESVSRNDTDRRN